MVTKLPTVKFGKKRYTVDSRLREFRFLEYGKKPEFIPFASAKGRRIIKRVM